ncbi:hypothetical protein PsYK624_099160 [Phanerochaete sordida]|uniref:Uncharacterized protein n=1 Tax=Phanerochaete sordida TaxID=48140 RepID=A0A9P3GF87_9APHY|nr:hypothetical protein PsYK624_099160 [Phanerochaete sordida]
MVFRDVTDRAWRVTCEAAFSDFLAYFSPCETVVAVGCRHRRITTPAEQNFDRKLRKRCHGAGPNVVTLATRRAVTLRDSPFRTRTYVDRISQPPTLASSPTDDKHIFSQPCWAAF